MYYIFLAFASNERSYFTLFTLTFLRFDISYFYVPPYSLDQITIHEHILRGQVVSYL